MIARPLKLLTTLSLCAATLLAAQTAQARPGAKAYALNGTSLVTFDPASPSATTSVPISGVTAGETLVGLDVRPVNGMLYALGVDDAADTATLYAVSPTGVATPVGTPGSIAIANLPAGDYGFDVNPVADRIRVTTSSGLNFRINPNTGVTAGVDANINGPTTGVSGSAYTNAGSTLATTTTLYSLDAATDALYLQNPPNTGTQTTPHPLTLNGAPLNATAVPGFDIDPAVTVATSNVPATGDGYALLTVGGSNHLYKIALESGAATDLGPVGDGSGTFRGLALQHDLNDGGRPAIGLVAGGTTLRRFMTAAPATGTEPIVVTGLRAGEILVGIAWRPATGQLLGLGADTTANTGTLYAIDPGSGLATTIGSPGQVQWVGPDGTTPVDLPPAQSGWGIDVNATVDRVRVVAAGGLNARVNPSIGAPVDGNLGQASPVTGTNPDAPHNGAATSVTGAAYTNAFAQGPGGVTTQYALDPEGNRLLIQNPPNAGTLLAGRPLTTGCGGALDFDAVGGLDLPGDVAVTTAGGEALGGTAYAALTVGGTSGVFKISLPTGYVNSLGAPPAALAGLAVGEADGREAFAIPACVPPPGPPAPPGSTPGPKPPVATVGDNTAPAITKLTVKARPKKRLTITFTVSEAGQATIRLQRKAAGRRTAKKRCVAGRKKGARCTLYKTYKTVTKTIIQPGKVMITTTGRTGAVRVQVTATDKAGNRSKAALKGATVKR